MNKTNTDSSNKSYSRKEFGDSGRYIFDSLLQRGDVKAKAAAAFEIGDFDYYFESIIRDARPSDLTMKANQFSDVDYWHYVRKFWCMGYNLPVTLPLIAASRPHREFLMTEKEHEFLKTLPSEIVIYRGCSPDSPEPWWSWSLSEEKARNLAIRDSDESKCVILQGRCLKVNVVAYFDFECIHEQEIIVNPNCVFSLFQRYATVASIEETEGKAAWIPFDAFPITNCE